MCNQLRDLQKAYDQCGDYLTRRRLMEKIQDHRQCPVCIQEQKEIDARAMLAAFRGVKG